MRRISALSLLLLMAINLMAGVCECVGDVDQHDCCKKFEETSVKRQPCCDEGACISSLSNSAQSLQAVGQHGFSPKPSPLVEPVSEHDHIKVEVFDSLGENRDQEESPPIQSTPIYLAYGSLLL